MRIQFRNWKPRRDKIERVFVIIEILKDLELQGIKRVTLRQLYYQLVSQNIILNKEKEYKNLSSLLTRARYSGLISWDAIEDRTRVPIHPNEFKNINHLIDSAIYSYEVDYWENQPDRVEVWVEKEALSNVVSLAIKDLHVVLCVNRGYSSGSAMFENAKRIYERMKNNQSIEILYAGDHDPSGLDMVRDIRNRLIEFLAGLYVSDYPDSCEDEILNFLRGFKVTNIALTMKQIIKFDLPSNPTKLKDTRSEDYITRYGYECWELDAMPPAELNKFIHSQVKKRIHNLKAFEAVKEKQERDIQRLKRYANSMQNKETE